MSDNTPISGHPDEQPGQGSPWHQQHPQYGAPSASGVPAWHPEANEQQRAVAQTYPPAAPVEDVGRGALFALLAVPMGIIVWLVLWKFNIIASIVAFGVAATAARLYVAGTRGAMSRAGAWTVAVITIATVLLSFTAGVWLDAVQYLGGSPIAMIADPAPWNLLVDNLFNNPDFVSGYSKDFLMALLFGGLGCFFTLRRLFAATRGR